MGTDSSRLVLLDDPVRGTAAQQDRTAGLLPQPGRGEGGGEGPVSD